MVEFLSDANNIIWFAILVAGFAVILYTVGIPVFVIVCVVFLLAGVLLYMGVFIVVVSVKDYIHSIFKGRKK